jgi:hypothetical protein
MRPLLYIEIKRQREGRGRRESPKRAPCTKFKDGQIESSVGVKRAESGGKDRQIRAPISPDYYFLRIRLHGQLDLTQSLQTF